MIVLFPRQLYNVQSMLQASTITDPVNQAIAVAIALLVGRRKIEQAKYQLSAVGIPPEMKVTSYNVFFILEVRDLVPTSSHCVQ